MPDLLRPLRRSVYENLLLPAIDPQTARGLAARAARFARLEHLPAEELHERQMEALRALLLHCYETCPFYTRRFDAQRIKPRDIRTARDLTAIPPLTRDDIRNDPEGLLSTAFPRESLQRAATGGTTDTPMPFFRDEESLREKTALHARFNAWAGLEAGDKVFYLWGAESDYAAHPSWRWKLFEHYVRRRIYVPASPLNEENFERARLALNRFQPRIIYAYPTPLALFAEYLATAGRSYHRPSSILCTAESLSPEQRNIIESVFGCKVFELYGAREFGIIAGECEQHEGMHWNPLATLPDFAPLPGGEDAGLQEMFVTDLLGRAMPLVRYRVNDCAEPTDDPCGCGRTFPRLRRITGRISEVITLPNGTRIPGVALTGRIMKVCPGFKKIQIIQETLSSFTIRYVAGKTFGDADLATLRSNIRTMFGDGLDWRFESVEDIPRERSGKTRFCISRVGPTP